MSKTVQIEEILSLIRNKWVENSQLRLMQLLGNALGSGDKYYIEDEELARKLKEYK